MIRLNLNTSPAPLYFFPVPHLLEYVGIASAEELEQVLVNPSVSKPVLFCRRGWGAEWQNGWSGIGKSFVLPSSLCIESCLDGR